MTILRRVQRALEASQGSNLSAYDLILAIAFWYGAYQGQVQLGQEIGIAMSSLCDYLTDVDEQEAYRIFAGRILPLVTAQNIIPQNLISHLYDRWHDPEEEE